MFVFSRSIPEMDSGRRTKESLGVFERGLLLYGIAFAVAVLVGVAAYFIVGIYGFILIPIIAYLVNAGGNMLVSYVVCERTQFIEPLKVGWIAALMAFIILLAVKYIGPLGYPIRALMPTAMPSTQDTATDVFYVFWTAIYAQLITGGMMQSCGA